MTPLEHAVKLIRSATHIALCAHISPDGDAIGSMLALGSALEKLGKHLLLLCDDPIPHNLTFLPGVSTIQDLAPTSFEPELLITLDSSDMERLGEAPASFLTKGVPVLVLDHHITNLNYGKVNVVMPDLASTAEIVLLLLDRLDSQLDKELAIHLLTGIVTDTRGFSTASVTPETLAATQRLMKAGANLAAITAMSLNRKSIEMLRMWGLGLTEMQWEDGWLWTVLARDKLETAEVIDTAHGGLSNLLISAEESHVAVVFIELDDGRIDVSMRAKSGYDVSGVALALGGGGHKLAAGCLLDGPLDEAVARVLQKLRNVTN